MKPQDRAEFEKMKLELAEMKEFVMQIRQQQIRLPLDDASIQVLNRALYNQVIDRLTVTDLRYTTLTAV